MKRLISINVHYSPRSFGGATIVAEEVNQILAKDFGWTVCVITTDQNKDLLPYQVSRYRSKGVTVISINAPKKITQDEQLEHLKMGRIIEDIVDVFRPSVVHMHAIQTMGVDFINRLKSGGIKMAATLHDCWWLCERQFMINKHGKYCFQQIIEKNVCMHCVDDSSFLNRRWNTLRDSLNDIDLLLFPSEFHRGMHVINAIDADKCRVNKNGVRFPDKELDKVSSSDVRFGFIGGPGFIKGGELITEVFEKLKGNYELKLVNAAQNVGSSWEKDFKKILKNKRVQLIDAYDQDTMNDFFANIDVLLFPSQWKESFGLTVREAMVRHVWVISTESGGTIEDMRNGENATVIPLSTETKYLEEAVKACMSRDWTSYKNPYVSEIKSYQDQAEEVNRYFEELLVPAVAAVEE